MGVSLYLFGSPRIEADGARVAVPRRKALALLAYLATSERAHSRDALSALLWPEWDGSSARTALRRVLVTANKAIGPNNLLTEQDRIGLSAETGLWVDVRRFRAALARSRTHRHNHLHTCTDCLGWLGEAAELYQDDFLAGFGLEDAPEFDDWQTFEAESLRRDAGEVLEKLAAIHAGPRDFAQAIDFARRWLALDPLHEPAHQMLIRLYAWAGDQAAALRQYRECAEQLQRELGVPPQRETTELHERVKAGNLAAESLSVIAPSPVQPSPAPAPVIAAEQLIRLPRLPDFVGRRAELAALGTLLADPNQRLLTILAMGGMGKSSLALVAAAQAADSFPDGVVFVPLAPLSHPWAIVPAIAEAIHYSFPPDNRPPLEQLIGYLTPRRLLLVLDNFEHLLDGAEIVAELLQGAPNVSLLVTSRERLNLRAETIFALEGMILGDPDAEADAVRLFVQSARRVQTGYTPRPEEKESIVEICRLVGGMPLGIVMAAGWMEILTPQEIAKEIRGSLDVLATALRDIPERQQSMRAVMDQTWARLNDVERDALMRLSVFRGGFRREAAQAVTGASLRTLLGLSNRQLLLRGTEGRYDLHELLRHFAQERLEEAGRLDAARESHSAYFIELLKRSEAELTGIDQQGALSRLRAEQENVRVAWIVALDQRQTDELNRAVEAYCLFYYLNSRPQEGVELCQITEKALVQTAPGSRTHARVLVWHGMFSSPLGLAEKSIEMCRRSLEISETLQTKGQDVRGERAFALYELGCRIAYENNLMARQQLVESLELCRAIDHRWLMAKVLRELARISAFEGDYRTAEEQALKSLGILREMGDRLQNPGIFSILCWSALHQDQFDRALAYAQDQKQLGEQLGLQDMVSTGLFNLSVVHSTKGEYSEAQYVQSKALAIAQKIDLRHHASTCRWHLCGVYIHAGHYQSAYDLVQETLIEADAIDLRNHRGHALRSMGMAQTVWESHIEARRTLEESIEIFQRIGQSRFVAYVRIILAYACYRSGDIHSARRFLATSVLWALEHKMSEYVSFGLPLAALLYADGGQPERAVELHALAWRYPRIANSRWFYDVAGRELDALAASLPPQVVAAVQEGGRALDLFATARELVAHFGVEER